MIRAGSGLYEHCADCGRLVKLNKWFFGDLHFCLTDEERKAKFLSQLMPENQLVRNKKGQRSGILPLF